MHAFFRLHNGSFAIQQLGAAKDRCRHLNPPQTTFYKNLYQITVQYLYSCGLLGVL